MNAIAARGLAQAVMDGGDVFRKQHLRRLARDYERLPETLTGLHFVAYACLMLVNVLGLLKSA